MSEPTNLPRTFIDEVETAMRQAQNAIGRTEQLLAELDELHRLALRLSFELGRPPTVFDIVLTAPDDAERARRRELVRHLRTD
jgi:hypothetical protein